MREIKFRGRKMDDSGWVYGYLTHTNKKLPPCIHISIVDVWEVKPDSIGQYTGLKDKNGKEIYEGDMIKTYHRFDEDDFREDFETIGQVSFDSGCFWINGGGYSINCHFHYNNDDREIIGNIYENPQS